VSPQSDHFQHHCKATTSSVTVERIDFRCPREARIDSSVTAQRYPLAALLWSGTHVDYISRGDGVSGAPAVAHHETPLAVDIDRRPEQRRTAG
jgi:hypothetical protein